MRKPKEAFWKKYDGIISLILGTILVIVIGVLTFSIISSTRQAIQKSITSSTEQTTSPTTYTVQEGDTLWDIAQQFYNSGYNWVDIATTNTLDHPDDLRIGQVLTIPEVKPTAPETGDILDGATTETKQPLHTEITVREGESLWVIAEREYGSGYKWVDIAGANAIITNPDLIYPNMVLRIP